jgi:hypothetical protein
MWRAAHGRETVKATSAAYADQAAARATTRELRGLFASVRHATAQTTYGVHGVVR